MRRLKWNEEYYLIFNFNGKSIATPIGRGFMVYHKAFVVKKRLFSIGAKNIKIKIRTF